MLKNSCDFERAIPLDESCDESREIAPVANADLTSVIERRRGRPSVLRSLEALEACGACVIVDADFAAALSV